MSGHFGDRYRAAVVDLLGHFPEGCGTEPKLLAAGEGRCGVQLPAALREYYLTLGDLHQLNVAHNRLLRPGQWFVDGGKLVFMEENQAVVLWGLQVAETGPDDPEIWQGVPSGSSPVGWYREHDQCSVFLTVMLYWQAVCGGLEWLGTSRPGLLNLDRLAHDWERVGQINDLIAFRTPRMVACAIGRDDSRQLFVGARSEAEFEQGVSDLRGSGVDIDDL